MRIVLPSERLPPEPTSSKGLGEAEVAARRRRYGTNDVLESRPPAWRVWLRETAGDPMIWFLVGTSALYLGLGERLEALTLLAALVPLVGMDAYLHRRTRASTAGLREHLAAHATVVREGGARTVPARDVVVGDLVRVEAGEAFAADGLVVGGEGLQAEESALTGEAYPVRKVPLRAGPAEGGSAAPVDSSHWGLAGTRLLTGTASLRVVFTGAETLYGQIAASAARHARARTPLQQAIGQLVAVLVTVATALCLMLAFVRWRQGHGWVDAVVSAATLGVAALPEEFPVAFTFFLGAGVYRLARRRALVRQATSVENVGRVSCICSDKTGTLTEGRLGLSRLECAPGASDAELLACALRASRPETGDPLDVALHAALQPPLPGLAPRATFPFTVERRRETAVVEHGEGLLALTKGSPEVVLGACALPEEARAGWLARTEVLAGSGGRVIACASLALAADAWHGGEPSRGLRFLGLVVLEDALRPGAREAVAACQRAGIRVVMVTGDHPATAGAVARALGLGGGAPNLVAGEELERRIRRGEGLAALDVVARALPAQKLALVQALQAAGEVVAVTGDGVNDVPALQAADVGVAMGERGTRSAREVASIVLLDDDFRSIVGAIAEGRQLFRNLRASFQYLLLIHVPLVLSASLVPLAGDPLLYLPVHIVWLELLIHPTAMLAFQLAAPEAPLARRGPVRRARFFSPLDWAAITLSGLAALALLVWGYTQSLGAGHDVAHARALAVTFLSLWSALLAALLSGLRTRTARAIVAATLLLCVLLVQVPALARALQLRPLHADDLLRAAAGALLAALPLLLGGLRRRGGRARPESRPRAGAARAGASSPPSPVTRRGSSTVWP